MTSKFFQQGSSSESSDNDSVDEDQQQNTKQNKTNREKMILRHEDDEYQQDKDRQVVSQKDKKFGKMKELIGKITDKLKISDFDAVYNLFEDLNKEIEKAKRLLSSTGIPNFYTRTIIRLENFLNSFSSEKKKALSKTNNLAFNKLKHHLKKNNEKYTKEMEAFKANPVETTESESEESEEEDDGQKDQDNESQDSLSDNNQSDSDSDSEPDEQQQEKIDFDPLRSNDPMVRRQFWLQQFSENKTQAKPDAAPRQKVVVVNPNPNSNTNTEVQQPTIAEPSIVQLEFTIPAIVLRLKDISENRTQKVTRVQYEALTEYENFLTNIYTGSDKKKIRVELMLILISVRSDFGKQISPLYMPRNLWLETLENLTSIFKLVKTESIQVESYHSEKQYQDNHLNDFISNNICSLFQELQKAFTYVDQRTIDYCRRVSDMYEILALAREVYVAFETGALPQNIPNITQLAFRRLESTYYLHDNILKELRDQSDEDVGKTIETAFPKNVDTEKEIHSLATRIYPYDEANRVRVELFHIYHHAIHNRLAIARDYLLMSRISDSINTREIHDQILYNRVLVQMGLASFRLGNIAECCQFLNEICSHPYRLPKDPINSIFLGQQPQNTEDDKKKSLPYHQHISLELIDTLYLISAMLLEIPNILHDPKGSSNQNIISKFFRKMTDNYDRSQFNGPPDTYKDYIYAASKELKRGAWKNCFNYLMDIPIIQKYNYKQTMKQNLEIRVKEQGFQSYIYAFRGIYDSLSIGELGTKFELDNSLIKSILYKMIYNKEIMASIDKKDGNDYIVFEQIHTTKLQSLASNLLEKISQTLTNNEKISDAQVGNYGFSNDDKDQDNNQKQEHHKQNHQKEFKVTFNDKKNKKHLKQKNM